MNARTISLAFLCLCLAHAPALPAADPPQPAQKATSPQPDFSPPPVPEFMLRRPEKPITLEEMQKQADEAARRARAERDIRNPQSSSPATISEEKVK